MKEQGEEIKLIINKGDFGFPHQRKYIIDAKWWHKWCDYTGFQLLQSYIED